MARQIGMRERQGERERERERERETGIPAYLYQLKNLIAELQR